MTFSLEPRRRTDQARRLCLRGLRFLPRIKATREAIHYAESLGLRAEAKAQKRRRESLRGNLGWICLAKKSKGEEKAVSLCPE